MSLVLLSISLSGLSSRICLIVSMAEGERNIYLDPASVLVYSTISWTSLFVSKLLYYASIWIEVNEVNDVSYYIKLSFIISGLVIIGNLPCVLIQRYNRFRIRRICLKLKNKQNSNLNYSFKN